MGQIYFDSDDDAVELVGALEAEGYTTTLTREAFASEEDWDDRAWVLLVEPFDDRVVEMVDVYGGWMPGDEQLPEEPTELAGKPKRLKADSSIAPTRASFDESSRLIDRSRSLAAHCEH